MRAFLLASALMLAAAPAYAALAPEYYELARTAAPHVVVVDVNDVDAPPFWRTHGECRVRGRVESVERGDRYQNGAPIEFAVPCAKPNAEIPSGATVWQDMDRLKQAARARAFLDEQGALALDQFDILR